MSNNKLENKHNKASMSFWDVFSGIKLFSSFKESIFKLFDCN